MESIFAYKSVFGRLYFHLLGAVLIIRISATLLHAVPVLPVLFGVGKQRDADERDEGSDGHDEEVGEVAADLLGEDGVADDPDREEDDDVAQGYRADDERTVLFAELFASLGCRMLKCNKT